MLAVLALLMPSLTLAADPVPADDTVSRPPEVAPRPTLTGYEPLDLVTMRPPEDGCSTDPEVILGRARPYLAVLARTSPASELEGRVHWGAALTGARQSLADPSILPEDPHEYAAMVQALIRSPEVPLVPPDRLEAVSKAAFVRGLTPRIAWVHVGGIGLRGGLHLACLNDGQWWIVEHESAW